MSIGLSEEQQMLQQSVQRFIERDYDFEARKVVLESPSRTCAEHWKLLAELGWLGVSLPEASGGFDGGPVENMLVAEAFGRAMVLEPFISTVVLCGRVLQLADNEDAGEALMSRIAHGDMKLALAFAEPASRYDLHHVEARAVRTGNSFKLNGAKIAVLDGPSADQLIVAARLAGDVRDSQGVGLFLVDCEAGGLGIKAYDMMDGTRAADLVMTDTPAELLVSDDRGLDVLESAIQWGTAARCAHAAGGMDAAYQQTLDYVKAREQFGQPIGSFQALQHRLVEVFMAVRECQSMMRMVAVDVQGDDPTGRRKAVSAAKVFIGRRARKVSQEVLQIHGGVGMTEELSIGHYFRTLTLFCSLYGTTEYHLKRYASLSG